MDAAASGLAKRGRAGRNGASKVAAFYSRFNRRGHERMPVPSAICSRIELAYFAKITLRESEKPSPTAR